MDQRSRSQWPTFGTWHCGSPRYIHTPIWFLGNDVYKLSSNIHLTQCPATDRATERRAMWFQYSAHHRWWGYTKYNKRVSRTISIYALCERQININNNKHRKCQLTKAYTHLLNELNITKHIKYIVHLHTSVLIKSINLTISYIMKPLQF